MARGIVVPRILGSIGLIAILATVAFVASARPDPGDSPVASEQQQRPDTDRVLQIGDADVDEDAGQADSPADEPQGSDVAPADDAPPPGGPGSVIEIMPGMTFTVRAPESSAQLVAAINGYRASRGLPAFLSIEPLPSGGCTWMNIGGSATPWSASPSESLAAAMIRLMPAAVLYQSPPGRVAVAVIVADSFIFEGVEYPGQVGIIHVKHCTTETSPAPSPPPVDPTPPIEPTQPPVPPIEPTPPVEPTPSVEPSPPVEPEPLPTP